MARSAATRPVRTATLDWLDVARDDDFVGVQTYTRYLIGPDGKVPVPEGTPTTQTGWEVYPESLGAHGAPRRRAREGAR